MFTDSLVPTKKIQGDNKGNEVNFIEVYFDNLTT